MGVPNDLSLNPSGKPCRNLHLSVTDLSTLSSANFIYLYALHIKQITATADLSSARTLRQYTFPNNGRLWQLWGIEAWLVVVCRINRSLHVFSEKWHRGGDDNRERLSYEGQKRLVTVFLPSPCSFFMSHAVCYLTKHLVPEYGGSTRYFNFSSS